MMIKLKSLEFHPNGIRKLRSLKLDFADRITLIAGHNGTGKSTILGLVASASGLTDSQQNYLNRPFSIDINDIIHLDPAELDNDSLKNPWPKMVYSHEINNIEHWKNIRITRRPNRLRSVASTDSNSPDKSIAGQDAKIPLPTIYLGMVRMLPIGESSEVDVETKEEKSDKDDIKCLNGFVDRVISGTTSGNRETITNQSITKTKKSSKHPIYTHTSKSISLGQDSLSSIATAITSFNKLKREMGDDYPGGLLVIDEIDAGLHPKAQEKLIDALSTEAKRLSLQIIATTHSPTLIEYVHPESLVRKDANRRPDKILYIADTTSPRLMDDWSLDTILADMALSPLIKDKKKAKPAIPTIKAYLEDSEAVHFLKKYLE